MFFYGAYGYSLILLYPYSCLSTCYCKTCTLKQITFVFAHVSLGKQNNFADQSQAWLFWIELDCLSVRPRGWSLLDKDGCTNISGNWLSRKTIGWIGNMLLIVQQSSPDLFRLGSRREKEQKHVTICDMGLKLPKCHLCFMLLVKN